MPARLHLCLIAKTFNEENMLETFKKTRKKEPIQKHGNGDLKNQTVPKKENTKKLQVVSDRIL